MTDVLEFTSAPKFMYTQGNSDSEDQARQAAWAWMRPQVAQRVAVLGADGWQLMRPLTKELGEYKHIDWSNTGCILSLLLAIPTLGLSLVLFFFDIPKTVGFQPRRATLPFRRATVN